MLPHKKLALHRSFSVFVILCILISIFSATIYAIGSYGVDLSSAAYRGLNIYNSPQCTWYCWGRAYEKCGVSLPGFGNANNWYAAASSRGYSVGTAPAANSIAVFRDVGSETSGYGHVAFVEAISGTTAYITEGNYEGLTYHEDTFDCGNGVRWPNSVYQQNIIGYIYLTATPSQPLPAPNAPSVSVNGSSVTVSWNAVPGATGYNVFAEKDGITTQWVSITSTESTISETRNNLADGDYAVYIVAYNDTERAQSDKSYFTIRTKSLTAPEAPSVTVNGSSITVSWPAVSGAGGYQVFGGAKNGPMWQWNAVTSTASVITMTYDNLLDGEYAIYIVAYNIDNNTKAQSKTTYFTIQTKPVTYSVTLDADGGTINSGNVTSYTEGVGATLPTDVTKDGYTFLGWFDGDTKVEVIGADAAGDKYFKAHWKKIPISYSVTLDTDGGTINSGNVTSYTEGVGATLPTDVTKDGYTFLGWFDGDTKVEAIGADAVGNKYFKAHWEKIPVICSVTLDTDGGTINSGNVTSYTEGVGVTLPTDVTKVGYTFLGWFDGDTKVEVIDTTATGDKSFRAKWAPVDCSIQLYAVLDGVTASKPFYRMTAKYGRSLQTALSLIPADALELAAYTRDHAFYYVTGSVVGPDAAVDLDVALYVKYKTRTFTVSFDLNDGTGKTFTQTVAYGKTATEPQPPKRPGYQFAGWYTSGRTQFDFTTPITQNITLKASWRAVSAVSDSSSQPTGSTRQDSSDTLPFRDVSKSSWYYNSVKLAWEKGLISGITATQYKPDGTLSVAQAIKLAAVLYQSHTEGSVRLTNGAPHWYDSYVRYAVDNSLLDKAYLSYTDKQMNAPIQRREFVHIFFRAADDLSACNVIADGKIPDVSMTSQYAAEIYTFYRAGILSGSDSAGTFYPESNIRRSEVAAILVRLFDSSARLKLSLS